eukprot:7401373-Pyramimonas_sp.AAC.1
MPPLRHQAIREHANKRVLPADADRTSVTNTVDIKRTRVRTTSLGLGRNDSWVSVICTGPFRARLSTVDVVQKARS